MRVSMLLMLHNQLTKRNKRFYIPGQACIRKCNRKQSRTKTQDNMAGNTSKVLFQLFDSKPNIKQTYSTSN